MIRYASIIILFLLSFPYCGFAGNSSLNNSCSSENPFESPINSSESENLIPVEEISDDTDTDSVHPKGVVRFVALINFRHCDLIPFKVNRIPSWISDTNSPPPDLMHLI